jgi:hypothetical protein
MNALSVQLLIFATVFTLKVAKIIKISWWQIFLLVIFCFVLTLIHLGIVYEFADAYRRVASGVGGYKP